MKYQHNKTISVFITLGDQIFPLYESMKDMIPAFYEWKKANACSSSGYFDKLSMKLYIHIYIFDLLIKKL